MDAADVITLIGIIITAVFSGITLYVTVMNQRKSQEYNLRKSDYEKRSDQLTDSITQYIAMIDPHQISFMALDDKEYEQKNEEVNQHFQQLEATYHKIKLLLNDKNAVYKKIDSLLDESMEKAKSVRCHNGFAEMASNSLRDPKSFLRVVSEVAKYSGESVSVDEEIAAAKKMRDQHLKQYLVEVEEIQKQKSMLTSITREYLVEERKAVLKGEKK